jgi:hypothetical protein
VHGLLDVPLRPPRFGAGAQFCDVQLGAVVLRSIRHDFGARSHVVAPVVAGSASAASRLRKYCA